ncbi:hypothetical protein AVEN_6237-1 [Araneus ventricosus]|uniref:Uncharacterized protein n=1 Tax=Araneus ventricosus TaxID=182803 RepID=A0A4Y2GPU5_ARAVE|nr:hypothetical protein AVEN_6237-1 [Araneus ventricosus]
MKRTPPELAPLSKLPHHTSGSIFGPDGFNVTKPAYTAVLQWNQDSSLEPSGPKVQILPPGHRCLMNKTGLTTVSRSSFEEGKRTVIVCCRIPKPSALLRMRQAELISPK